MLVRMATDLGLSLYWLMLALGGSRSWLASISTTLTGAKQKTVKVGTLDQGTYITVSNSLNKHHRKSKLKSAVNGKIERGQQLEVLQSPPI